MRCRHGRTTSYRCYNGKMPGWWGALAPIVEGGTHPQEHYAQGRRRGCRGSGTTASAGLTNGQPQRWRATSPRARIERRRHRGRRAMTDSPPCPHLERRRTCGADAHHCSPRHARRRVDSESSTRHSATQNEVRYHNGAVSGRRRHHSHRTVPRLRRRTIHNGARHPRTERGPVLRTRQHRAARSRQAVIDSLMKLHAA